MPRPEDPPEPADPARLQISPTTYSELKRLASRSLQRAGRRPSVRSTDLVHDVYARLAGKDRELWKSRAHFIAGVAQAMRQIIVDLVRRRAARKRGGDRRRVSVSAADVFQPPMDIDVLALEDALTKLEVQDARQARIVEMRFFGGLTIEEIARSLGLAKSTVDEHWRQARAWLARELGAGDAGR